MSLGLNPVATIYNRGYWSNVRASATIEKLGALSPLLTVLLDARAPKNSMLPDDAASQMVKPTMVPQPAVGAGKVIAPLFEVTAVAPVPDEIVVDPDDCVPAHCAKELV